MPNYKNGKIYKIESIIGKCVYIGSTTQKLSQRMTDHKKDAKKKNVSSYKVLKYPDAKIYLLLEYSCDNKEQLFAKEGEYIRKIKCVNKQILGRTQKQWRIDNKERLSKQRQNYYFENKDKIYKYRQTEKYKNSRLDYAKQYRIDNLDKIKEYTKLNVMCNCGSVVRRINIKRHLGTPKHKQFISNPFHNFLN